MYPVFKNWSEAYAKLVCFHCGDQMLNMEESTGQNGGPPNAPGEGEHRSRCGSCGRYTYFDVTKEREGAPHSDRGRRQTVGQDGGAVSV